MEISSNTTLPLAGLNAAQGAEQTRGTQAARPETARPVESNAEGEGAKADRGSRGQTVDIEV